MKKLFKRISLGNFIAQGNISAEHGAAMLTKGKEPSHTSWWPFDGVNRATLFEVIEDLR